MAGTNFSFSIHSDKIRQNREDIDCWHYVAIIINSLPNHQMLNSSSFGISTNCAEGRFLIEMGQRTLCELLFCYYDDNQDDDDMKSDDNEINDYGYTRTSCFNLGGGDGQKDGSDSRWSEGTSRGLGP